MMAPYDSECIGTRHTGNHLDFFSFHPLSQKRSVSSSLYKRAKYLCSEDTLQYEYKIIERLLVENNCPPQFAKLREPNQSKRNVHQPERKRFISTPYIKGVSERVVERILNPHIMLAHISQKQRSKQNYAILKTPKSN